MQVWRSTEFPAATAMTEVMEDNENVMRELATGGCIAQIFPCVWEQQL